MSLCLHWRTPACFGVEDPAATLPHARGKVVLPRPHLRSDWWRARSLRWTSSAFWLQPQHVKDNTDSKRNSHSHPHSSLGSDSGSRSSSSSGSGSSSGSDPSFGFRLRLTHRVRAVPTSRTHYHNQSPTHSRSERRGLCRYAAADIMTQSTRQNRSDAATATWRCGIANCSKTNRRTMR